MGRRLASHHSQNACASRLESKPHLQINPPVGGVAGEEASRKGVGSAKNGRTEAAHGRSVVDGVKNVPSRYAKGEVEPPVGVDAAVKHVAGPAHTAKPRGTKAPSAIEAWSASSTGVTPLHLLAKANGLAQAKVGGELAEAGAVIGRNDFLSSHRHSIKVAPSGGNDIGFRETRGEGWPVIEDRVAVYVLSQRDVEGRGGIRHDKRKDLEAFGQIPTAPQKKAVPHIVGGAPVIFFQIVRVHGEGVGPSGVAVSVTKGIKAKDCNL